MRHLRPARIGLLLWVVSLSVPCAALAQEPVIAVWPAQLQIAVEPGGSAEAEIMVSNTGQPGSNLLYTLEVVDPILPAREITGSTLSSDPDSFLPGWTGDYLLTVYNGSPDFEWLTEVSLNCPAGVTVIASTDFVGGTGGALVSNQAAGDGAKIIWTDENGGWGNIFGEESATATVRLYFAPELSADLHIPFVIKGDEYGNEPHQVTGKLDLHGPWEYSVEVMSPNGGEIWVPGEQRQLLWACTGPISHVDLDLSRNGGGSWESLAAAVPNNGLHEWQVTGPLSAQVCLRVSDCDGNGSDESDGDFFIHQPVDWLSLPVSQGSAAPGEVDTLLVQVDAGDLDPAQGYHALIEIRSNAVESPVTVPVFLNMMPTAADASPGASPGLTGHPNPFNPRTTLSFDLESAGLLRLEVFDLQGRLLRVLAEGKLSAGSHQRRWDGRDAAGRPLPSGVYFARLQGERDTLVIKLLLLK